MLTILFYFNDGPSAKKRSRALVAVKGDHVRVIDVCFWNGEIGRCDQVEIMPDVPGWQRKKIEAAYGDKIVDQNDTVEPDERGEALTKPEEELLSKEKKAVHRGGGRWFVMEGEKIISGPHDKNEAKRLAGE